MLSFYILAIFAKGKRKKYVKLQRVHCSVAFCEEDNVFFGKIEGIDGLVNFEGSSVEELKEIFHEAVDDYLTFINDYGKD